MNLRKLENYALKVRSLKKYGQLEKSYFYCKNSFLKNQLLGQLLF